MNFKFRFPKLISRSTKSVLSTNNVEFNNILLLREQLILTGYNPGEIDYMINTWSNGESIHKLAQNVLKMIERSLEQQLSIARQSIELTRRT